MPTDTDTSKDAGKTTTDDVAKDAGSAKAGESQEGGTADKKDADKGEDVTGLKKALQAERKRAEALEKEKRDAELSKLPELERAQTLVKDLEAERDKLKTENMRYKIALDLGLTWTVAKRLTGETEDEMRADGAELLKQFKGEDGKGRDDPKNKVKTPSNDAKKTGTTGGPDMNSVLRAMAGRTRI